MRLFRKSKPTQDLTCPTPVPSGESAQQQRPLSPSPLAQAPPPALQLNLDLPALTQSTLGFNASILNGNSSSVQGLGQAPPHQGSTTTNYGVHSVPPPTMPSPSNGNIVPAAATANNGNMSDLFGSYDFDYNAFQFGEEPVDAPYQDPKTVVNNQLVEQFGRNQAALAAAYASAPAQPPVTGGIPPRMQSQLQNQQPKQQQLKQHAAVPAAVTTFSATQAVQMAHQAQQAHQVYRAHQMNRLPTQPATSMVDAQSSKEGSAASSDDEDNMPVLKSTLASADAEKKLSDRAMHIQKVREASAMGKFATFNRSASALPNNDSDDDSMPLGGLRQATVINANYPAGVANGSAMQPGGGGENMTSHQALSMFSGSLPNGPIPYGNIPQDGIPNMARQQMPPHMVAPMQEMGAFNAQQQFQQHLHQFHPGPMPSPNANMQGLPPRPQSGGGYVHMKGQFPGGPMMMQQQSQQQQQMGYMPRSSMTGLPMTAGGPRSAAGGNPVANIGSASVTYGNIGLHRANMMAEPGKLAYTPSPLGQQPPVFGHQHPMGANGQMMPVDMRMPQFLHPMMGQMPMHPAHSAMYVPKVLPLQQQQQPMQQQLSLQPQPQQAMTQFAPHSAHNVANNGQQGALMSFIPSQGAFKGSISKNPLMRDINKIKEFSAKDYNSRPTLLAEADTRRLAMKNIPGLGGSTCHSFQPKAPSPQLQPAAIYQHQPPQPPQPQQGDQSHRYNRDHAEYQEHARGPHRFDLPYHRSSSCQNLETTNYECSSVYSGVSNGRNYASSKGIRNPTKQKHQNYYPQKQQEQQKSRGRYDRAESFHNSEYEDRHSVREFRQTEPPRSSRSRPRTDGRRRQGHPEERHYEYYEYNEYSDEYLSDGFNEWDEDEYDRHNNSEGAGRLRRRAAQRRNRGDMRSDYGQDYGQDYGRSNGARNGPRRDVKGGIIRDMRQVSRIPVHLDDPRDSIDMLPRVIHREGRRSISTESEASEGSRHGMPRSQFGRMLANIKRRVTISSTSSINAPADIDGKPIDSLPQKTNIAAGSEPVAAVAEHEGYSTNDVVEEAFVSHSGVASATATPTTAPVAVA
ncbi:hypothetical protein LPJ66_000974 [Kickxella alabastrina]|uniref:Uncharacterized protein n=1 Tax=Kickxella alabastrina TaxID=61397 RepID=A0ACC1IUU7_9FUNG|nr:hypothetical protein LPJ66_000974 [Kickxella alabastrina]